MNRLSRRSLLVGSAVGLATLGQAAGARLTHAQGAAAYDIVSFGPLTDEQWVRREGRRLGTFGGIKGIDAGGTAFGNFPQSEEKFSPALFTPDGALTRLPSGTFGGYVNGINANAVAAGAAYDDVAIVSPGFSWGSPTRPVIWRDNEMIRLPLPDTGGSSTTNVALGVSDDGVVLGQVGFRGVLWTNDEPELLPEQDSQERNLSYRGITASGAIVANVSFYDSSVERTRFIQGFVSNGDFIPVTLPEEAGDMNPIFAGVNSADEILFNRTPTDLPFQFIVALDQDPVVIDLRDGGIYFSAVGFNASHEVIGNWQPRAGLREEPALWRDGEVTPLSSLLPADHGYHLISVSGISDDGIISGSGWDADYAFHPLLFVPR